MLRHFGLCVGLYLGLGPFSVIEFWSMQGVSDAMLGHAALRLCWPYLRLTLSNIRAILGCCCVPLSPCWADVERTCLGTAALPLWSVTFVMLLCSVGLLLCLSYGWWMVVYWWSVSDDLMVSWWSVGAVLAQTVQCFSLYCASASSWRFGMRVQCCVCEVFF